MSQHTVGIVIDRLLNDQDLRVRFALDRIDALADLNFLGIELTPDEIEVFMQTDARVWFWGSAVGAIGCTDDAPRPCLPGRAN